jgi:hypothetical protein
MGERGEERGLGDAKGIRRVKYGCFALHIDEEGESISEPSIPKESMTELATMVGVLCRLVNLPSRWRTERLGRRGVSA